MLQPLQWTPPNRNRNSAAPSLKSSSSAVPPGLLTDKISKEAKSITPDKDHDVIMNEAKCEVEGKGHANGDVVMKEANGHGNGGAGEAKTENGEADAPAGNGQPKIILSGTLGYSSDESARLHAIRGNWKFEHAAVNSAQRFELLRSVPPDEDLTALPADGEYHGTFSLAFEYKSTKGKTKLKRKSVAESGVVIRFAKTEEGGVYAVKGRGLNEYGTFDLVGTATKSDMEDDPGYLIKLTKAYIATNPPIQQQSGEDKRRLETSAGALPPPYKYPETTNIVCLRGKLSRTTSENLSLGLGDVVHKICGVWSMGLKPILDDPLNERGQCNKFDYEHKCSGESTVFPLSGKYTGWFFITDVTDGVTKTKVPEKDVILKFSENSEGFYNVEGKGSNIYGKYTISGTLDKEGVITLFRHFMPVKVKISSKKREREVGSLLSSTPAPGLLNAGNKKEALAPIPPLEELPLSFDDVQAPDGTELVPVMNPPLSYGAVSKGIFKITEDGSHSCSGNWAITFDQLSSGSTTSSFHFGLLPNNAAEDAKTTLERMESSGASKNDDRKRIAPDRGGAPTMLNDVTFPIDSARYRGSFKMKKGVTKATTVKDEQIILKFVKNSNGSYNVYGKGINSMGTYDIVGTLITQAATSGHLILYRVYPPLPEPEHIPAAARSTGKVFPGSLTEKAVGGRPPAMKPPEKFTPSASSLQRRESGRQTKVPTRLEDDSPEAQRLSLMEKCRPILKDLQTKDGQGIFARPVDPVVLHIPTYFDVIKEPMDLGTIQMQIETGELESPEEFIRLVRLVFQNAITFNSEPDNVIGGLARQLLAFFNSKIQTVERVLDGTFKNKKLSKSELRKEKEAAKDAKKKGKRKVSEEGGGEAKRMKLSDYVAETKTLMDAITQAAPKSPDVPVSRNEFNLLIQLIQLQNEHTVAVHKLVSKSGSSSPGGAASKHVSSAASVTYHVEDSRKASTSPKKKKPKTEKPDKAKAKAPSPQYSPKQSVENLEPLTIEEQVALSEGINNLPDYLLPGAMQIIREADTVNDDDDEIDLDLDMLDITTQRKLQRYINENCKPKKKKKEKRKSTAPAAPVAAPSPPHAPSPESEEPTSTVKPRPSGKTFFSLGQDDSDDSDSEPEATKNPAEANTNSAAAADPFADDDDAADDDEDDELKVDIGVDWLGNTSQEVKAEDDAGQDAEDDGDDLWGAAKKEAEASKALEADRAKREEKMIAEANMAKQKRIEEAQALGEEVRAKREEEAANEARRLEELEREAEKAKNEAKEKALEELNIKPTIDLDAQRELMRQYEQEFNDNYSAGASPSSDFGF